MKNILFVIIVIGFASCTGTRPEHLGWKAGQFHPCPSSPNCVNTYSTAEKSKIDPIAFETNGTLAKNKLKSILKNEKRVELVEESSTYLYYEFTSKIFRFVDDVEFFFDANEQLIHFRSASRLGHSDLGTNRKRMEKIRRQLAESAD